ncbi:small acid-soluble spore protein L (minor) [Oikeobacillus pervagus]|uniref:Small, acid-soluble spore protein L n=1 Tax=Oikeobacillus pervagus TaxID=1325931 RepID=A0AAJ1SXN1_9BACI|nr:small, acid-soluble spore protein L [Oikeobacillus pervagus]MDQ0213627.1 small acid-soluble spore protein L (minor) [Oikeobacillus pervagus]
MSNKKSRNRGTNAPGVNPQGFGQDDDFTPDPKSKLENAAKKKNTK